MNLSLILCTFKRAKSLSRLLDSIKIQSVQPDEIIIVDGSPDDLTQEAIKGIKMDNLSYHKVNPNQRGLTKQRNIGIELCDPNTDIVAFLDDDTILLQDYFKNLKDIYENNPNITGVGGVAVNQNNWEKEGLAKNFDYIFIDGYKVKISGRYKLRKFFGLMSSLPPGKVPKFSHGNTQSYPLNGKFYKVDLIVGMSMSFRSKVAFNQKFSEYFEGYGLYEDADYSIRALNYGDNVIATNVQLEHHHHPSGRPNQFKYGQMVVKNGWYVWRLRWPKPGFKNVIKWHLNVLLLATIRLGNAIKGPKRKQAFTDALGRYTAWLSLFFNKPNIQR